MLSKQHLTVNRDRELKGVVGACPAPAEGYINLIRRDKYE